MLHFEKYLCNLNYLCLNALKIFMVVFALLVVSFTSTISEASEYDWQNIKFSDRSGNKVSLGDYKGNILLVKFWAPWCKYCVRQMPVTSLLARRFSKYKDFKILPISIDYKGRKTAINFYKDKNIKNLPILADPKGEVFRSLGLSSIPVFLLISKQGDIIEKYGSTNQIDIDELEELIKAE